MQFSAKQIAEYLKGDIEGDQHIAVTSFSKIEEGKPGTLTFLANPKYEHYLYTTKASIVLVNKNFVLEKDTSATLIRVDDPYQCLAALLTLYEQSKPQKSGIHPKACIADSAIVPNDVYIGAFSYIGENVTLGKGVKIYSNCNIGDNVSIGNRTTIYAGISVYDDCKIGANCIFHAGCVIGSDGFGFAPQAGDFAKIPQIGNVIIEDNVEIGANTVVDRATMGSTIVRKGVKLDNLIQVAHNVEIGENTVIAGQTGIAGSTKIGKNCMIGGQVGFAGHISIADGTKLGAQSGVNNNIKEPNKILLGSPAYDVLKYRKSYAVFKNLPNINKTVYQLEKEIERLKASLENE